MTGSLRDIVASRSNDYEELERRYRAVTGSELVIDPFGSAARDADRLTRSASVLIGTHNCLSSLVPTLVALEQCSFNRAHPELLEVIVVDDGSTDDTRATLLGTELDLDWRYVRQERGGLTTAHNTGLSFAQGDVVVFCDADVVQFPRALEELMKRHEVLDRVTLIGFRVEIDPADPRLERTRLAPALAQAPPAFWRDFRLCFPGWPANTCRDTRHLRDLGFGRHVRLANGAEYDLANLVVGAFFSIGREQLLAAGASDERLSGWGCEDSLIGARSIALGNSVIPVYSAVGWHVWHPRRDDAEISEFRRNLETLARIYDEPFQPQRPDLLAFNRRAIEVAERQRPTGPRRGPHFGGAPLEAADRGAGLEAVGRFAEAIAAFDRAPTSPATAVAKARCLRALNDHDAAVTVAQQAVELAPDDGEAALVLALALADVGAFAEARVVLESRRRPTHPAFEIEWVLGNSAEHHKRRGNRHAAQGLHRIAATDFAIALIADPSCVWAHFDQGQSLRELGRASDALKALRRADNLVHPADGNRTWIHSSLAVLHAGLGNDVVARAQLERAVALYPENPEAVNVAATLSPDSARADVRG